MKYEENITESHTRRVWGNSVKYGDRGISLVERRVCKRDIYNQRIINWGIIYRDRKIESSVI